MASSSNPDRPVVEHFSKDQRQRLEALQFAKELIRTGSWSEDKTLVMREKVQEMLRLADYITTGVR